MVPSIRNRTAVVGTAFSEVARRSTRSVGELATEAALRAIEDAGLSVGDIDGLCVYPNPSRLGGTPLDGQDYVSRRYMTHALGTPDIRWSASVQPGSTVGSLIEAANALHAGACRYVLIWRAMHNPRGAYGTYGSAQAHGPEQFRAPYGLANVVMDFALPYSRYQALYGATREQMATFVVANRQRALGNPDAVFRDSPLTVADYLADPMIASPLSRLDCDMPVDGCGAVVLTTAERARDLRHRPAYVRGYASGGGQTARWAPTVTLGGLRDSAGHVARTLWEHTGLGPTDLEQINLYDGFSFFIYLWLEALGFCALGEAGRFLQGPDTAPGGRWPLNTNGGALGMGRLHGMPQIVEAVRQVQDRCGSRQVADATHTLAISGNAGNACAAVVFSREP